MKGPPKTSTNSSAPRSLTPSTTTEKILALLSLGALWLILCRHLSGEWSSNEQYSYGWFVPFFAAYLFWLRWEDRPAESRNVERPTSNAERRARAGSNNSAIRNPRSAFLLSTFVFLLFFLLFPIRLFEIGIPDWRPLGWVHATVVVSLTLWFLWLAGGRPWLRHFAFPVAFIFAAVPWLTYLEGGTTNHLMAIVAGIASETLALFGIPAQLEGNLIRVSTGVVGVNEACSGVRSLQTAIMIGLLFGELKRLSSPRRVILFAGAVAVAMVANICRAIFLVYIAARQGLAAVDSWHDGAGYAILAAVFVATVALAAWLGRQEMGGQKSKIKTPLRPTQVSSPDLRPLPSAFVLPTSYFLLCLSWLVAVEVGVEAWYWVHEGDRFPRIRWTIRWPEGEREFRPVPTEVFRPTLLFDEARAASWQGRDEPGPAGFPTSGSPSVNARELIYLLYFFRWEPGRTTVLRARAHRPDTCLPNLGWKQINDHGTLRYSAGNIGLPFRHLEFARLPQSSPARFAHAFYCAREDRVKINTQIDQPFGAGAGLKQTSEFLRPVFEGEREKGLQVLQAVLVSSREIPLEIAKSRFAELAANVIVAVPEPAR